MNPTSRAFIALALAILLAPAVADEAAIRKSFSERIPQFPKIEEVNKTAIPGVYEVRIGSEIYYTDEQGNYLIAGQIVDTKTRVNLTEERIAKLTAIDFKTLPLKDAMVWKQGTGERKLVVFADPNCGYCKKFERDLLGVSDITVYVFMYPILSPDSIEKSKKIMCSADPGKTWIDWMVRDVPLQGEAKCDTAMIEKNVQFGHDKKITGTPTMFFVDGERIPGAIAITDFEKKLASAVPGKSAKTAAN